MFLLGFSLALYFTNILADTDCPYVTDNAAKNTTIQSLRLVQYNTEWLFLDYYSGSDCPGSGCTWNNNTAAETHMSYISNIVSELNPDVINICEVEGCDELNALILGTNQTYSPYLIKGSDTSTGQNVGFLSKISPTKTLYRTEARYTYPISISTCGYTGSPSTSGVTKHYITEFMWNNMNIAMIGAHLLAYPTEPDRCAEREAQAMVLHDVIQEYYDAGYEIIVLGDFNDFDGDNPDVNNNIPTSQVLNILKGKYSNYTLYSASEVIQQSERYSDWWDENNDCQSTIYEFSVIDHILLSETLYKSITNAFFYHEYGEYCGTYNSDHYPLVVDFDFTS
jgi:exonuclease III